MTDAKIQIVAFDAQDVIATSGGWSGKNIYGQTSLFQQYNAEEGSTIFWGIGPRSVEDFTSDFIYYRVPLTRRTDNNAITASLGENTYHDEEVVTKWDFGVGGYYDYYKVSSLDEITAWLEANTTVE